MSDLTRDEKRVAREFIQNCHDKNVFRVVRSYLRQGKDKKKKLEDVFLEGLISTTNDKNLRLFLSRYRKGQLSERHWKVFRPLLLAESMGMINPIIHTLLSSSPVGELLWDIYRANTQAKTLDEALTNVCENRFISQAQVHLDSNNKEEALSLIKQAVVLRAVNSEIDPQAEATRILTNNAFRGSVRIYVETLPRSGTHYLLDRIMETTGYGFASISSQNLNQKPHICVDRMFAALPSSPEYVLKSHFFAPVASSPLLADDVTTLRQVCFFFDSFYSWAHLVCTRINDGTPKKYDGYRVSSDSDEWRLISGHFPVLMDWLEGLNPAATIRYEDYETCQTPAIVAAAKLCSSEPVDIFHSFQPDQRRIYYSNGNILQHAARHFDDKCVETILSGFLPFFQKFYPETDLG
jgi:hypothetical protein